MELAQEILWITKQLFIPCVSRPALALLGCYICNMPVHVHDSYTERYPLGAESVHEVQVFVIGIGVETAPPIAESITWQHRRPSAEFEKVIKRRLIFKAVTEEI